MTLDKKLIDFESKISKYENELLGLSEEKEYWKSIANQPNQYEVSHVADDIIEKFRENEKARIRAQEDAEYYRSK